MAIERYIAGGRVYFSRFENGAYQPEYEIGEVIEASIESSKDYAEAFNKDNGQSVLAQKVIKKEEYKLSFKTQNINADNLATALGATKETVTYAAGDTLPDGSVADADGSYVKIVAGKDGLIEGKIKFISAPLTGKKRITEIPRAFIGVSGNLELITDDFASLEFEANAMQDENGQYYIEYVL